MSKLQAKLSTLPTWQRNLFILWFGVFMTGIALSEVLPFLSLYINTLGNYTKNELTIYSGVAFAMSFFVQIFVSPMWGRLADSKGRKLMLLRASLGMAIVMAAMGLVTNVWQLIALRALQGFFGGFISNATAMVAAQTPKVQSGYALGILTTGATGGQLLGPLVGGTISSLVSFRMTFFITGGILILVFLLTFGFVIEDFTPVKKGQAIPRKEVFKMLKFPRLTLTLFITTLIIQVVNQSISPIVSLFVRQLNHGGTSTTFLAGVVAAMPGIATVLAAPRFGKLGDKIGTHKMTLIGFSLAFIFMLPTGFVTAVWQLIILRFMIGISDATMLPAVQTMLTKSTPTPITSRIFAYNQSFQAAGSVIGPLLGSLIGTVLDFNAIFIFSALLILVNAAIFYTNTKFLDKQKA